MTTQVSDGRDESADERSDRNWAELLQELRVMQMGVQILTGFLLTLPFQQRFGDLDTFQTGVYLTLVALAVLSTGLFVTPVSLHRALFRKHRKTALVTMSDRIARVGVLVLAFVVTGTVLLVVDVVVNRTAALWSYQSGVQSGGEQHTASMYSLEPAGSLQVRLILRRHADWGQSVYLHGGQQGFTCGKPCTIAMQFDEAAPLKLEASIPEGGEPAIFIEDDKAFLGRMAGAKKVTFQVDRKGFGK